MKAVVEFSVQGSTKDELYAEAKSLYNNFMGTEDKDLPHNVVINIEPTVRNMEGDVESWKGEVHISENLFQ